MKKVLLLLYIALSFSGFSQTNFRFADSTAQWNVLDHEAWSPYYSTIIYKIKGDTTIGTTHYQQIEFNNSITHFIRQDSMQRVFYRRISDTVDFMIYDFGKNAGDTFSVGSEWGHGYRMAYYVCSIDTVNWGKPRKRMMFRLNDNSNCNYPVFVAVEGIGIIRAHFLYPDLENYIFDYNYYELLCYSENNNVLYNDTNYTSCVVVWNSISEIRNPNSAFRISPNPATTYLTIQSNQNISSPAVFQLYDITGRMILQKPLTAPTTRVELSDVSKGMYLYNVVSEKEKVGAGKLIIE